LKFVHELSNAGLPAVAGHLNTESILFSLIHDVTLTFGTFENTRIFSLDKFIDNEEERRGPKARIYLPALLNWVRYEQAMEIRDDFPDLWDDVYTSTAHSEQVIAAAVDPTFNQPGLYKHHFVCMTDQIRELGSLSVGLRFNAVRAAIKRAMELHEKIQQLPLDLDSHGNGAHLEPWLDAINRFYRRYLKA
jgi:hypothetical protein